MQQVSPRLLSRRNKDLARVSLYKRGLPAKSRTQSASQGEPRDLDEGGCLRRKLPSTPHFRAVHLQPPECLQISSSGSDCGVTIAALHSHPAPQGKGTHTPSGGRITCCGTVLPPLHHPNEGWDYIRVREPSGDGWLASRPLAFPKNLYPKNFLTRKNSIVI